MTIRITRLIAFLLAAALLAPALAGCTDKPADANDAAVASTGTDTESVTDTESGTDTAAENDADPQSDVPTPTYDYSAGLGKDGYFTGVKALDFVTLPEYLGIGIPAGDHEVTDEELEGEISSMLASFPQTRQITDRAVSDGDKVNIDYVGSVDGVEFPSGSTQGNGTEVTAGAANYIDDFLTQIIGHMPGETFDVNVTFPDEYPNDPDLAGKDAVFVTTINYISEQYTPELTDEFVMENLNEQYGWESAEEVREYLRDMLSRDKLMSYLDTFLSENCVVSEIPQAFIDSQRNFMLNYFEGMAAQYGTTLEELLPNMGVESIDGLVEAQKDALEKEAKAALIVQAIAEKEGIVISESDVDDFLRETSPGVTDDMIAQIKQYYGMGYIAREALEEAVYDLITGNAVLQ